MVEPGQRELLGAHRAAGVLGGLEHEHGAARLGEPDRGGEAVRAAADDDRVAHDRRLSRPMRRRSRSSASPMSQNIGGQSPTNSARRSALPRAS